MIRFQFLMVPKLPSKGLKVTWMVNRNAQISDSRWYWMLGTLGEFVPQELSWSWQILGCLVQTWWTCFLFSFPQDALQEMYNQEGIFPGKQFKPPRRPWTLLNFLFWATVLLSPLFTFGFGVFASGSPLLILAFLGLVGAGNKSREDAKPRVTHNRILYLQ